jgi:hypothetical protein
MSEAERTEKITNTPRTAKVYYKYTLCNRYLTNNEIKALRFASVM